MKEKVANTKIHKIENWANNLDNYNSRIVQIYLKKSDKNSGVDKKVFFAEIEKQDIPKGNYYQMRTNSGNSNGIYSKVRIELPCLRTHTKKS